MEGDAAGEPRGLAGGEPESGGEDGGFDGGGFGFGLEEREDVDVWVRFLGELGSGRGVGEGGIGRTEIDADEEARLRSRHGFFKIKIILSGRRTRVSSVGRNGDGRGRVGGCRVR